MKSQFFSKTKILYSHISPDSRKRLWQASALALLVALAELALSGGISLMGVAMAAPQTLLQFGPLKWLFHFFPSPLWEKPANLLALIMGTVLVGMVGKNAFVALQTWVQVSACARAGNELGYKVYQRFLYEAYLWHTTQNAAELFTKTTWKTNAGYYFTYVISILTQLCIMSTLLLGVLIVTPGASIFVFFVAGVTGFLTYRLTRSRVEKYARRQTQLDIELSKTVLPSFHGIREVLIYRQQQAFLDRFKHIAEEQTTVLSLSAIYPPIPTWILECVGIATLLVSLMGMILVDTPLATLTGSLTLLAAVAWRLLPAVNKLVGNFLGLKGCLPTVDPFIAILQDVREMHEDQTYGGSCPFNSSVSIDALSFRYPSAQLDALKDIDIAIPKGSMVGFVGPSGSGKSTLVGLLTGLFEPTSGSVRVDGIPLTPALRAAWTHKIGYVPQSPYLLDESIAANIAFSQYGKQIDFAKVEACCKLAAMDFVSSLPEGVHTVIGERGVRLSGGQIQRISIARAFYASPELVVFDEATSALDGATEMAIQQTINGLRGQTTMVLVAHRLSTVEACDLIYWIEDGRVVDKGPPSEILPRYQASMAEFPDETTAAEPEQSGSTER